MFYDVNVINFDYYTQTQKTNKQSKHDYNQYPCNRSYCL